jgi:His/Glu/Gln/Arg/opine family amino acid ABC transporter permease subunit
MNLDWSVVWEHREALASGVWMTVVLSVLTMVFALILGFVVMLIRNSRLRAVSLVGDVFVEFFRNLPLILVIYWAFYVLPILLPLQTTPFATGLIALTLGVSAYTAETFRAGINSIRVGQSDAALALGMTRLQVMRIVVFPQAIRRVTPAMANIWVALFKDTSLVSIIAVAELTYTSMQLRSQTFRVLEFVTAMTLLYWCLGYPQAKLVDWINRKFGVSE